MILQKKIKIDIYHCTLNVLIVNEITELNKYFEEEHHVKENSYSALVFKKKNDKGIEEYYVGFEGIPDNGIIAHEIVHIVNLIFQNCMIQLDINNDEPQAYLTGYLFNQIEKKIKQMKNGK